MTRPEEITLEHHKLIKERFKRYAKDLEAFWEAGEGESIKKLIEENSLYVYIEKQDGKNCYDESNKFAIEDEHRYTDLDTPPSIEKGVTTRGAFPLGIDLEEEPEDIVDDRVIRFYDENDNLQVKRFGKDEEGIAISPWLGVIAFFITIAQIIKKNLYDEYTYIPF